MTEKKMADIFFKKFLKLISKKPDIEKTEKVLDDKIQHKKKLNKIFIFSSVRIIVAIIIYSLM